MTKKELEAMNGETKTYKLGVPVTWFEFKMMPHDVQEKYLNLIINKF